MPEEVVVFSRRGGGGVNKTCDQYVKIIPDQVVCLERSLNGFAILLCSCFSVVIILCVRIQKSDLLPYMHAMNIGPLLNIVLATTHFCICYPFFVRDVRV